MKTKTLTILLIGAALILAGCKDKNPPGSGDHRDHMKDHAGDHGRHKMDSTKIIDDGDLKIVFDLMTKDKHAAMMKMMGSTMKHDPASDQFVVLTLLKKGEGQVKDAKGSISITDPAGKSTRLTAQIMEGKGMYHYCADFKKSAPGAYKIEADLTVGGKAHKHQVEFNIN